MRNPNIKLLILTFLLVSLWVVYKFKILRYLLINLSPLNKKLLERYKRLPRVAKVKKVIISFTTIPNRIEKSKYMLTSILDQTVRVDEVRLYIPPKTFRGQEYKIPKWMTELEETWPEFSVKVCEKDWGPATKIIPAILDEKETDNFLIYMDDDMVYHKQVVETLISASNRHPNQAICNAFTRRCMLGFAGCLVRPKFFDIEKLVLTDKYPKEVFFEDDVFLSGMLTENKTKIFCTRFQFSMPYLYEFFMGLILGLNENSLSSTVNKGNKNFIEASKYFNWD